MTMITVDMIMIADNDDDHSDNDDDHGDNDDDHGDDDERQLYRFWRERGTVRGEGGESALAGRPGERGARLKIAG